MEKFLINVGYTCKTCKRQLYSKANLKKHVRNHTSTKPYKCSTCEKAFAKRQNLNRHKSRCDGGTQSGRGGANRPLQDQVNVSDDEFHQVEQTHRGAGVVFRKQLQIKIRDLKTEFLQRYSWRHLFHTVTHTHTLIIIPFKFKISLIGIKMLKIDISES